MKLNLAFALLLLITLLINNVHAIEYNLYKVHDVESDMHVEIEVQDGWVNVHCSKTLTKNRGAKIQATLEVNNNKYELSPHRSVAKTGRCRLITEEYESVVNIASDLKSANSVYVVIKIDASNQMIKVGGSPLMRLRLKDGIYHENTNYDSSTPAESKLIESSSPKKSTQKIKSEAEYISTLPNDLRNVPLIAITPEIEKTGKQNLAKLSHHYQDNNCVSASYTYARSFYYWNHLDSAIDTANNFVKMSKTGLPDFTRDNVHSKCNDQSHLVAIHKNHGHGVGAIKRMCDMAGPTNQRNYNPPATNLPGSGISRTYCWDRELIEETEEKNCLRNKNGLVINTPGLTAEELCKCKGKYIANTYITGYVRSVVEESMAARRACDISENAKSSQNINKKSQPVTVAPKSEKKSESEKPAVEEETTSSALDKTTEEVKDTVEAVTKKTTEGISKGIDGVKGWFKKKE